MAHQQAYQAYPQNKGTLIPGQSISVNNYSVQVERYLSQGGFAHVYLVRTPQPVYNTTHHVLKRIAVANESMLTDVKKEVDIMRLLKGHPNIVHLIDASWHKLPNGTFEVFILMEFCPGGGIIDMMNRRLRERLTEAEILQIFVDVCEGVAYMHNSRPPLLHRDLKVENILQSSPTSFKLCDFGSATTVSNPPTNMQEIRALEADLNRHTTLQYRAPEMVDVYSKRAINEKSDVWALGVLLYKLCYYTTPFEEHGPLAILNVQYRIPPYPVYSQDMNMLIASMLREHGAQRPTVFELLNHVHRLRGTRSKFTYSMPSPQPALSRSQGYGKPTPVSSPNPMDGVVTFGGAPSSVPNVVPANQGIQARDRVLEAIAPMRRGRPAVSREQNDVSRPASPQKPDQIRPTNQEKSRDASYNDFTVEQEKAWKAAMERSATQANYINVDDAAWSLDKPSPDARKATKGRPPGFGDDFAESLWTAPDPNLQAPLRPRQSPSPNKLTMSVQRTAEAPLAFTGGSRIRPKQDRLIPARDNRDKDAFEGLGLMTNVPKTAPTLGEARKLRTGLAIMSTPGSTPQGDYVRDSDSKLRTTQQRPTPSPQLQPRYLSTSPLIPQSVSPVPTPGSSSNLSFRSSNSPSGSGAGPPSAASEGNTIEARFPSLEELDAQFSPPHNSLYPSSINDAASSQMARQTANRLQNASRITNIGASGTGGNYLKPAMSSTMAYALDGTRSEQVTGIAMRDAKDGKRFPETNAGTNWTAPEAERGNASENNISQRNGIMQPKPLMVRKHRSSTSMKPSFSGTGKSFENSESQSSISTHNESLAPPKLPTRPAPTNTSQRDWLTGDDQDHEEIKAHLTPDIPVLRDSPSKRASLIESSNFRIISSSAAQHVDAPERDVDGPPSADLSPTVSKFKRAFPALEPFDADKLQLSFSFNPKMDSRSPVRKEPEADSSSADEGPEDPSIVSTSQKRQAARARGRQSSVHDLVYQYGGGLVTKDKDKENDKAAEKERERPKPAVQYNVGASDYTPRKSRPSMPGLAPPANNRPTQTTPSPTSTTKLSPLMTYKHLPATTDRPQPPPPATKPVAPNNIKPSTSARSRPQSMFIFPSKSADSSSTSTTVTTPTTNSLVPPPDPRPRATRRTSISDMVQRYEAIGSTGRPGASIPPTPPSPIHKPVASRATPAAVVESNRVVKSSDTGKIISAKVPLSNDSYAPSNSYRSKSRSQSKDSIRRANSSTRSPSKIHRKLTSDRETPAAEDKDKTPRSKRISIRAGPSISNVPSRVEPPAPPRATKPATVVNSFALNGSPRKPPVSLVDDAPTTTSKAEEPRSPSPERPYQGVGKLIDQWQKKSAEADHSRPGPTGKRGDLVSKRAGMIQGEER